MIKEFVQRFDAARETLRAQFKAAHPDNYKAIVQAVVTAIAGEEYESPTLDPKRIVEIDHGHYQGTLLYVIAEKGYQPDTYYAAHVNYGSCSGCDTLQGIRGYSDEPVTDEQANDYLTLALHVVQRLRLIGGESA